MRLARKKGINGMPMAEAFARKFLTAKTLPVVIKVAEFDQWADDEGYLDLNRDRDTVLTRRNSIKNRINWTACSEVYKLHNEPFFIAVEQHGVTYTVDKTEDAYDRTARLLPIRVKSLVDTKRKALNAILGSVDLDALPPPTKWSIEELRDRIEDFGTRVDGETTLLDNQMKKLQTKVRGLIEERKLLSNSGVQEFLETDEGAEQDDETLPGDSFADTPPI